MMRHSTYVLLPVAIALLMGACNNNSNTKSPAGSNSKAGGPIEFIPEPERIVLEVEKAEIEAPFELGDDSLASGGKCVVLAEKWETHQELHPALKTKDGGVPVSKENIASNPDGTALIPNGSVRIKFGVSKEARYALWARAFFHCSCGDSFFFSIDSDMPVDTDGDGKYDENLPEMIAGSTRKRWKWFEFSGRRFKLKKGEHVLAIYPREDGIKLDQILLSEVPEPPLEAYVPQGIEEFQENRH